ncbi:MAG: signal recognition particle 19 kDa protein, partial [halophilic archaeon J07HB67]
MVENVLWPAYFDAELSRSDGRRLPVDQAVSEPTVDEIAQPSNSWLRRDDRTRE